MTRITKTITFVLGGLLSILGSGCPQEEEERPDPIIGYWESTDLIGTERNELQLDATLRGEARIYFFFDGQAYYADFDVTGRAIDPGVRYELEMDCEGDCASLSFDMECDMYSDMEMDCEGDGDWSQYGFEWAKR